MTPIRDITGTAASPWPLEFLAFQARRTLPNTFTLLPFRERLGTAPPLDDRTISFYFGSPDGGRSSMVEPQIVVLVVAGSSPVGHPIPLLRFHARFSLQPAVWPVRQALPPQARMSKIITRKLLKNALLPSKADAPEFSGLGSWKTFAIDESVNNGPGNVFEKEQLFEFFRAVER